MNSLLIVVGSSSVHTIRFITALSNHFEYIAFISNDCNNNLPQNVICHKINFKLTNTSASKHIAKIIQDYKNKNDNLVIHIHQANSYAYHTIKAVKKFNIKAKLILTTWGSDILILPQKNLLFKKLVQYNLNNADVITSDSLYMSSKIYDLLNSNKRVKTINFGIQDFPKDIDLEQKENIILSNRLHKPLYQIDKIIEAFATFIKNSRYSNYKLIVAGSGEETDNLKLLANNLNLTEKQIVFTGMISYYELQEWYKKAKIFISIPKSDATSVSLLEAMAYGCYPILTNLPANLEWVINDINGLICQNIDKLGQELEIAIEYITNSEQYNKLATFNYELIAKKAQFSDNINQFIKLYD